MRHAFLLPMATLALGGLCANDAFGSLTCQDLRYPGGGFACASQDEPSTALATFRKMPTWGGNAALTLIDICEYPKGSPLFKEVEEGYERVVDLTGHPLPGVRPLHCVRRYCTTDERHFSFLLNGLPIPIGYVGLQLTIGFSTTRFEVKCENLGETGGGR